MKSKNHVIKSAALSLVGLSWAVIGWMSVCVVPRKSNFSLYMRREGSLAFQSRDFRPMKTRHKPCAASGGLDSRPVNLSTVHTHRGSRGLIGVLCKWSCWQLPRHFVHLHIYPLEPKSGCFFFASGGVDSRHANLPTCKKNNHVT